MTRDPTSVADDVAASVRAWYEANREGWWARHRPGSDRSGLHADRFMLRLVDTVRSTITEQGGGEAEANAKLFAAAPDMLAALKSIEWGGDDPDEYGDMVACCPYCGAFKQYGQHYADCAVDAAIRKAGGRT